ncbi:MAG: hypothetical protein LBF25_01295 [Puniceicoccales bacterium]|jgi:hypothetical protein|nr:hypothetical protein [Puniceicoccales bacterium]
MDASAVKEFFSGKDNLTYSDVCDVYGFDEPSGYFFFQITANPSNGKCEYIELKHAVLNVNFGDMKLIERLAQTPLFEGGVASFHGADISFDPTIFQIVAAKKIPFEGLSDMEGVESEFKKCIEELSQIGSEYASSVKNS